MRRGLCYDHLDLRRQLFEEVVETLDVFSSEGFYSQALNSKEAVSVEDTILIIFCQS